MNLFSEKYATVIIVKLDSTITGTRFEVIVSGLRTFGACVERAKAFSVYTEQIQLHDFRTGGTQRVDFNTEGEKINSKTTRIGHDAIDPWNFSRLSIVRVVRSARCLIIFHRNLR